MSASLVLRGLLVSIAVISLSLKVANGMVAAPAALDQFRHQLAGFLEREGFRVDGNQQDNDFHLVVVRATRDECRLLIAVVSSKGEHRAFLTQLAAPSDQVRFVFQGKIYKEQPIWRPLIEQYLLSWLQNYIGIGSPSPPTVGVVAPLNCDLSDVAWRDFGVEP